MASTQIATVFLDRELRITRYTPSAVSLFNFIPSDVGRPLTDLKHQLDYPELEGDARRVRAQLAPFEREVSRVDEGWFLARLRPYRTVDDHIAGVVLTFVDITQRHRAEASLRENEAWLAGQKEAFLSAMKGAPLEESLGVLVRTAVAQMGAEARCAFYIVNDGRAELVHITGMPAAYAECVDGFKVGADALACGLAVYTNRPIITPDVTQDPRWKEWLWLAEKYDYRACWSFPIETEERVVGTLAMYFPQPREATARDHAFAAVLTRAAAIVISRHRGALERVRVEQALRASEERFSTLASTAPALIWHNDAGGGNLFVNQYFVDFVGLSAEEIGGAGWQAVIHPDDREAHVAGYLKAVRGERAWSDRSRIRRHDGVWRWFDHHAQPIFDAGGGCLGHVGASVDITERVRGEESLRRNEELFSALVENAPFGVYLIDADFRLRTVNAGSRRIFSGVEPLIGRDFAEVLRIVWAEPFASEAIERFRFTLATGQTFVSPPTVRARGNIDEFQSYDWQIHRVVFPDGSHGVVCYYYDLTMQKRLEGVVAATQERLRLIVDSAQEHAIISMDLEAADRELELGRGSHLRLFA